MSAASSDSMKDCTGREYAVEDFVSFVRPSYHDIAVGRVVRFTPKNIKVLELKTETDATGRLVIRPGKWTSEHTVKPDHATIINETAATWLYIPWAE